MNPLSSVWLKLLRDRPWRSLRIRSWLVIVAGLLLMQTLGFGVISYVKEQQIRASMLSFMSKDAALAYQLLQGATPEGREIWLKALDRGFYRMQIGPLGHPNETVRAGILPALEPVQRQVAQLVQREDVRWIWLDNEPTLELPLGGDQALHMVAADPLPSTTLAWWAAYAGVLLLTAGLVAWAVVRMLMHPLNEFFTAARAFGQDIQNPLLQVTGPTEVREVARVFNQMQVRIRGQIDERTQIVSSISHDLQTPITRLRLRADLIEDEQLRQKFARDLDAMSTMIREGLDYAKSSQLREARVPIDLVALAESLADQAADLGQDVQVEGRIERPYVGALRAMERALLNLINNAVKFGGRARVLLSEDAAGACIQVVDPGPGVPPDLMDQLFDPFFRVESSRSRDHGGTGLGLTIARNLIRAHGGDITVANGEGSGFVATLTLPRSLRG